MEAHDRRLPDWFSRIQTRQITLPRFQRFVAWGHGEVADLLTTVLRGLYDLDSTGTRLNNHLVKGKAPLVGLNTMRIAAVEYAVSTDTDKLL